ncbi:MAG: antitoxin VapB family protein [Promethearchaeota archaeon]
MASQQISIKQDVYTRLKEAKKEGESFSDTINRLLDQDSNTRKVINLYGIAKIDDDYEELILKTYNGAGQEIRQAINNHFEKKD